MQRAGANALMARRIPVPTSHYHIKLGVITAPTPDESFSDLWVRKTCACKRSFRLAATAGDSRLAAVSACCGEALQGGQCKGRTPEKCTMMSCFACFSLKLSQAPSLKIFTTRVASGRLVTFLAIGRLLLTGITHTFPSLA